jgi:hypothetical protein
MRWFEEFTAEEDWLPLLTFYPALQSLELAKGLEPPTL